jgi:hypothetical protein
LTGHVAEIELFAYPWDILDRVPEAFAEECSELGVTRVHVTALYHSGKFLLPRNRTHRVVLPQPGCLFVRLPQDAFSGPIRPDIDPLADSGWVEGLARTNLPLAAWTVFHHSSALASRYPQFAIRNLDGDVYPFALCPSHEAVRTFSQELAAALRRTGYFTSLDLETIGYLGYSHGHHHEVTAVPAGPLENFLLSLCFCDACLSADSSVPALRSELCRVLEAKLRADDASSRHPDNGEQIATLLIALPELRGLIERRIATVSSLIRSIGRPASVFTSSFVGSPSNIWMEGVSLAGLREEADRFHLLAYTADSDAINGDLVFCLAQLRDPSRVCLTLNLGLPITPTLSHAMAKIDFAWRQGVRRFGIFNYGFLGEARLRWIAEIAAELRGREGK